ncbi:hypothetical protein NEAUS05_1602 [Nematocida ausubeli]|nr:hypothetical protein NEAUS05_1602 [Nematocida ausubeli]
MIFSKKVQRLMVFCSMATLGCISMGMASDEPSSSQATPSSGKRTTTNLSNPIESKKQRQATSTDVPADSFSALNLDNETEKKAPRLTEKDVSDMVKNSKKGETIWNFLKQVMVTKTAWEDRLPILENMERQNDIFSVYSGYYSGMMADLQTYMGRNAPQSYSAEKKRDYAVNMATLGDILIRRPIRLPDYRDIAKIMGQINRNETEAFRRIIDTFMLYPELYCDMKNLTLEKIKKILQPGTQGRNTLYSEKELEEALAVVSYLWKTVRYYNDSTDSTKQTCASVSNEAVASLKSVLAAKDINVDGITEESIGTIYKAVYEALTVFYTSIAAMSHKEKQALLGLKGTEVFRAQKYLKYQANIVSSKDNNGAERYLVNTHDISEVVNRWETCVSETSHFHIHYVDNEKQSLKRMCIPRYNVTGGNSQESVDVHPISYVIDYIRRVNRIKNETVYAMKTFHNSNKWSLVSDDEKNKTIEEMNKEHYTVVFYRMEKKIQDNYFICARFTSKLSQGEYSPDRQPRLQIPLFISPLHRSAMKLLSPFVEEHSEPKLVSLNDLQNEGVTPSTYMHSSSNERMTDTTLQAAETGYYTELYIHDEEEKERVCYTLEPTSTPIDGSGKGCLTWYVRMDENPEEYEHYLMKNEGTSADKLYYRKFFINSLNKTMFPSMYQVNGVCCAYSQSKVNLTVLFCKNMIEYATYKANLFYDEKDLPHLMAIKARNHTKSSLGVNNDILKIMLAQ